MNEALAGQLIHPSAPPAVSWWPLAPGWWLLAAIGLLLCALLPVLIRRVRQRGDRRSQAQRELARIAPQLADRDWLAAHNALIKRLLRAHGRDEATRLYGEAWLDFLCQSCPSVRREALQPLAGELYRPTSHLTQTQRRELVFELQRWMRHQDV